MPVSDSLETDRWERQLVPARYSLRVVRSLELEGVPANEVLAETDLRVDDLAGDATITHEQQRSIYANAASLTKRPSLGLALSERQPVGDRGVYGYAIQSSADLAQALRILVEYQEIVGPLLSMRVSEDEEVATIAFDESFPLEGASRVAREEAVAILLNHVVLLAVPRPTPIEIRFDLEPGDGA